ncbi:hypothetical protein PIB30_109006, partial [Stylosanthes scabra]|nr:hypothetical protein [Stylosanthes scabra]
FPRLGLDFGAWALKSGAWACGLMLGLVCSRLGVSEAGPGRMGMILGAWACSTGRLGVQLVCCNFPRVVPGSDQLSTIDIYIPNRSPGRKLSNAIGIRSFGVL